MDVFLGTLGILASILLVVGLGLFLVDTHLHIRDLNEREKRMAEITREREEKGGEFLKKDIDKSK